MCYNVSCLRAGPFFLSGADNYTGRQCLTHSNTFLRLYVNKHNCNKSYLGTCFSRLVPAPPPNPPTPPHYTATVYLAQRLCLEGNQFSLANLVLKLSQEVCLGKGSLGILSTLKYSFYLFSAASWKTYNALLKPVRVGTLLPASQCLLLEVFSILFTGVNIVEQSSEWLRPLLLGPKVKFSPLGTINTSTVHYKLSIFVQINVN